MLHSPNAWGARCTARGASAVMLAGGTTPHAGLPRARAQPLAHDDRLHVLFSDERYVAADSRAQQLLPGSRPLLQVLALPPESLLRVPTELPLDAGRRRLRRRADARS